MHCIEGLMWHVCSRNYEKAGVPGFFLGGGRAGNDKLYWMDGKEKSEDVYVFVAERWVDNNLN